MIHPKKEGAKMRKKRRKTYMGIMIVCSLLFLSHPVKSDAKSTTTTIGFSEVIEQETSVTPPTTTPPLIKYTKVKKVYQASSNHRLPMTGEEYTPILSGLGWVAVVSAGLFFFMGEKKRKGVTSNE